MTLPAALEQAEQTGQPVTVDLEDGLRARVRISEYGERQLTLYTRSGPASEVQAVAAAVEAGFQGWTVDRAARALLLTEVMDGEETESPVFQPPKPAGPYRPGLPLPARPLGGQLYHGDTPSGHLFTVLLYGHGRGGHPDCAGWRCDALNVVVCETDRKTWSDFLNWRKQA